MQSIAASWQSGSGNSGTIFSQNLTYDPASNLISLTTTQNAAGSKSGGTETSNFCYDEQNRLVWAGNSGTQPGAGKGTCGSATLADTISGANYADSYVYTHLGQLWQAPCSGGSTQYQYLYCNTQPHELTGLYALGSTCSSKSGQGYASSYDAFGNVTTRTTSGTTGTLTYDLLDHFTQWYVGANNQEQYLYDASGQRMLRRVTNSTSTTLITYPFGIEEHQYSGTGTNQANTYYYFLAGHLLGSLDGNGTQFYLTDALGSLISSFTNAQGGARMKSNQVFGPYGNARYTAGNLNTAKGFIGQYNDNTGLDYFNARYYDPVVGVFLSADTAQGNAQGMNPYAYVNGNPETYSDPSGQVIAGQGGETYVPGSPYYMQNGEAYSITTGKLADLGGKYPGWYPGQGPNAGVVGQGNPKIQLLAPPKPKPPTQSQIQKAQSIALNRALKFLEGAALLLSALAFLPGIINFLENAGILFRLASIAMWWNPFAAGALWIAGLAVTAFAAILTGAEITLGIGAATDVELAAMFQARSLDNNPADWTPTAIDQFSNRVNDIAGAGRLAITVFGFLKGGFSGPLGKLLGSKASSLAWNFSMATYLFYGMDGDIAQMKEAVSS